ncbi:putative autophagy-related protein 11 isoform X1 [Linepithema humile]|uniref:putative autophagy-related protein 11 isoform X1 n=1 Tax=Linepithema humile TaxID=83485 RepID=UPI00351EACAD
MFSRAAKSVVKSLGSRQIQIGEKNFQPSWIITANRPCSTKISHPNATINNARTHNNIAHNLSNLQGDNGKNQTDQLVEALYRLPIAEEASTLNSLLIPNEIIPKAANVCSRMRPYARIIIMDPSNNAWHRDYTIAAICKWFPDTIHLPFQAHDISFISESKNFKSHRSIKRKKENKNLFCVANKNDFLSDYEKPTTELIKECRNAKIFSSTEARCRTTGKSANWVTDWVKSKLLHEICNHSRGYVSWFFIKAFAVNNVSINLINNHLLKKKNIIDNKNTKSYFSIKCKNNDILVALNRNSKAITGDTLNTVEEENWIQRISCKIKSILPDLHAKIRSRSTTVLNLYYSENIFAVNESIPISEVISNRIFFASKDCDSKSSIRRKIEEFCIQRKKSFRKKADKDDICKKRERSCKTAEKKCQKKEKTCGKKEIDCSKRRKQTCEEQRKVSCKKRKGLDKDVRDCRKTREMKPQEEPSKEYKDCDTSKTKEDFCQRQRRVEQTQTSCAKSATIKQTEKDICKKSEEDEYQRSYDENDKCTKEKKRRKEEDEKASCKQKQKETCQEKKKTDCEEEKKSKKSECSEIRKIDLCKKKECPPVTKAPSCSDSSGKTDEREKTCRKYSTYALQNNSQRSDENH